MEQTNSPVTNPPVKIATPPYEEEPVPKRPLTISNVKPTPPIALFGTIGNTDALFEAKAKFREQLEQPKLDGTNPYYKSGYLTLAGLVAAIDEGIKGTGLDYYQVIGDYNGGAAVQTVITHKSGGVLYSAPFTLRPQKNDPQGVGSATTYARRYQLQSMFGIAGEADDDGNKATYGNQQPQQRNYNNRPQQPQRNYNNYQQQ